MVFIEFHGFNSREKQNNEYNEVNNEYEYKNIKILNDLELTYYVDKNKYGIVGTIENNSKVNYKDIEITLELFDDKGNKIDDFIIKIDKMSVKDKIRINEEIKDYGVLVYEHKITNIKGKEEK